MLREQYVIANSLITAAQAADCLFSAGDNEPERINDDEYMGKLHAYINASLSQNQIENACAFFLETLKNRFDSQATKTTKTENQDVVPSSTD